MRHGVAWVVLGLIIIATSLGLTKGLSSYAAQSDAVKAKPETTSNTPQPYMRYRVYGGAIVEDPLMPPTLPNGMGDYAAIFARHNICSLVRAGEIDEVWIWAGNGNGQDKPHLLEWTTSGPGWGGLTPDCGKIVTTFTYNYTREVDVALETFSHRLGGFFSHYIPCDFSTATWPWEGQRVWPVQCAGLLSDRYGFVARPFSGNDFVGGCGDEHAPPNILDDQSYNYSSQTSVQSICPDWSQDGSASVSTINCQDWGCTHWGYHLWWMQNLPGLDNSNRNRYGQPHINWWTYLFSSPGPTPTPTASPTATLVNTPGPSPTPTPTPTATATPVVLFSDNFTGGVSPYWGRQGGNWSAEQDEFRQTDLNAYDTYAWVNGLACNKTTVAVRVKLISVPGKEDFAYAAGPVLKWQDSQNLYLADLTAVANQARIYRRSNGSWSQLAGKPYAVQKDRWYDLEFSARDGRLSFSVDGVLVLQVQDTWPTSGAAGLRADRSSVAFDDFRLLCQDQIPPTQTATHTATPTSVPSATATPTKTPTRTPTLTPSPTLGATDTPASIIYLPVVLRGTTLSSSDRAVRIVPTGSATVMAAASGGIPPFVGANQYLATEPGSSFEPASSRLRKAPDLHLGRIGTIQPPVAEPVVYVIYYPGYGTPRADVSELTNELIDLLEKATVYHGYLYDKPLRAVFLGQDGASYAGRDCNEGSAPDNIHVRITGMYAHVQPLNYRVEDPAGGGVWANPCSAAWLLYVVSPEPGVADLYFKPFRDAPDGTLYTITVRYSDGSLQATAVAGTHVRP